MLVYVFAVVVANHRQEIGLSPLTGPIMTSVRIKPGTYTLEDKTGLGAIQVGADGITIDFQGATLQSPDALRGRLETFNGIRVSVAGHKNVTIRNAHIHGYQFNVKVLRSSGIKLVDCELSQSRSQRILRGEGINNTWLNIRSLEAWEDYGAAAWVEKSSKCVFQGLRSNQSQNGLMLVNSNGNKVVGCDFSFNSGWGIALWGSSQNLICWNHADFVNRPWSGGWGADSSGVVLTSASHKNILAYNSFTHSGDGFFLATQNGGFDDAGKLHEEGTCDRNQIAFNDGSWSTANAFESTFSSQNLFYKNFANDSNYGFWLGYSKGNLVQANQIKRSHVDGIAHEQGSLNLYLNNDILDTGGTAIHLWSGSDERLKQSPSENNVIIGNHILNAKQAIDLKNSRYFFAGRNVIRDAPTRPDFKQFEVKKPADFDKYKLEQTEEIMALKPKGFRMYRDTDYPKGWQWIAATAYGMRDFRNSTFPWMMKDARTIRVYTPPSGAEWRIDLPDWMQMVKGDQPREQFISPKPTAATYGEYREFKLRASSGTRSPQWLVGRLLDLQWRIRWFKWFRNVPDAYGDTAAWSALFSGPALKEEVLSDLPAIEGYRPPEPGLPSHHFALQATTKIKLDAGSYRFDTISDDGIQVLVDGAMVVSNWTHHGATGDSGVTTLASGVHDIEVHYCQEDGGAALSVKWTRL